MKTKQSKIKVYFVTETKVELTVGNRKAQITTPDHADARQLAALAEADLLDVYDDHVGVRYNKSRLNIGSRIVSEIRHGKRLFIAESRKGKRRLIHIYDIQDAANN